MGAFVNKAGPLLIASEVLAEIFWIGNHSMQWKAQRLEHRLRTPSQISVTKARPVHLQPEENARSKLLSDLAHSIYPILHFSTEQSMKIGVMLHMPIRGSHHFWWVEPSLQECGPSLIDSQANSFHRFYRYSIGTGYRRLLSPAWLSGGYVYYDYNRHSRDF